MSADVRSASRFAQLTANLRTLNYARMGYLSTLLTRLSQFPLEIGSEGSSFSQGTPESVGNSLSCRAYRGYGTPGNAPGLRMIG